MIFSDYLTVWIDADSCPAAVRNLIFRFALRNGFPVRLVANREIPFPPSLNARCIITKAEQDAADDYIAAHAKETDIVITRDIPLAARLIQKGLVVLNDRGTVFSADTITERLSVRNFAYDLAMTGVALERTRKFGKKELTDFANSFNRELQKKRRAFEQLQA